MPNRIIRESICTSDTVDQLSWFEEVFFYRLIVNCDDYGRFDARPAVLKSRLFPLKDKITAKAVEDSLKKLATVGLVQLYECDQRPYLQLRTWVKYQNVRTKKSKFPTPEQDFSHSESNLNTSASKCIQMYADVPVIQSVSESVSESKREGEPVPGPTPRRAVFTAPTVDDVADYCKERGNKIDAQRFVDYYQSNGWMRGKTKIKDWKACVRTWEQHDSASASQPTKAVPVRDMRTAMGESTTKPGPDMFRQDWNKIFEE